MKRPFLLLFSLSLLFLISCSSDNNDPIDDLMVVDNDDDDGPLDGGPIDDDGGAMGNTPCENGMADIFPCNGYDLLGRIPLSTFNAGSGNDIWGWTDPMSGNEYALVGLNNGTAFVDITDEENLIYLGKLPTATTSSSWRDLKVYQNFVFIGSEAGGHGMQIFDLTRLRDVSNPPVEFDSDIRFTGFGNSHNLVINEESGYAYAVGTAREDEFNGGVHFVNIQDPLNPAAAGGYGDSGYTHDAQVVTYNGPDTDYTGREIFIGANETRVVIVDVTDKDNPSFINSAIYSNIGYTHQGWFTEDQRYFILGDEADEVQLGVNSRTIVFDLSDLDNPLVHTTYTGPTEAIDHNGYVKEDQFFLANYTAGVRILDISDLANETMVEVGYFDTFPTGNAPNFSGVWSVYPYFSSGKIVLGDVNRGLFVIRASN